MAKGKRGSASSLVSSNFLPILKKPSTAIGKTCHVPGSFWARCPAGDKSRKFKCIIVQFEAVHDFGEGGKLAAFQVKEMGEKGEGSLEPGVASGEDFFIAYPNPFLQCYYDANPEAMPESMRPQTQVQQPQTNTDVGEEVTIQQDVEHEVKRMNKPPVFEYLKLSSSSLNTMGNKRGTYTNKYVCCITKDDGTICGGSVTLYQNGDKKAETTSNAFTHIRDQSKKDGGHKLVLNELNRSNAKSVLNKEGEYVKVMNFREAPH